MNNETQHTAKHQDNFYLDRNFPGKVFSEDIGSAIAQAINPHFEDIEPKAYKAYEDSGEIERLAALIASAPSLLKENEKLNEECVLLTGSIRELSSSNDALVKENQELKEGMNEVIGWRNKVMEMNAELKSINEELIKALEGVLRLAEHGVDVCANNSRPEERDGHKDGLLAMIEQAKQALSKSKTEKP